MLRYFITFLQQFEPSGWLKIKAGMSGVDEPASNCSSSLVEAHKSTLDIIRAEMQVVVINFS